MPFFSSWGLRIGVVCKGHIYSAKHDNTTDFTAVPIGFDRHTHTHTCMQKLYSLSIRSDSVISPTAMKFQVLEQYRDNAINVTPK